MKTIGVVTVGRSDFGILRPLLNEIEQHGGLNLVLYVTGAHLSPEFGNTQDEITEAGFEVAEKVEVTLSSDSAAGISKSMGLGVLGFSEVFSRQAPDILVIMGDRFEMMAAALAAVPFNIQIAHIHGGEVSEGAIDEVFRHAITKMSHLHFPATEEYAQRIIQMGEHPERVFTCGAPGLDNLNQITRMSARELEEDLGVSLDGDVILVTYHPVTRELGQTSEQFNQCLLVLKETETTVIFTYPNADPSGRVIIEMINQFVESQDRAFAFENLGTKRYFSLMSQATVMLGNSSSGIIEAASFGLPVLNIGNRQRGRSKGRNVVDVAPQQEEMGKALSKVLSREFRQSLDGMENIYGDGHAAAKIATVLSEWKLDSAGAMKSFFEG